MSEKTHVKSDERHSNCVDLKLADVASRLHAFTLPPPGELAFNVAAPDDAAVASPVLGAICDDMLVLAAKKYASKPKVSRSTRRSKKQKMRQARDYKIQITRQKRLRTRSALSVAFFGSQLMI